MKGAVRRIITLALAMAVFCGGVAAPAIGARRRRRA